MGQLGFLVLISHELRPDSILCFCSNSVINNEAANEACYACEDASLGGWRSTHNHEKKINHPSCGMDRSFLERDDDARCSVNEQHKNRMVNRDNGSASERRHFGNALSKRQKKHGLRSRNQGESSTMVPDDLEILFLGSSGESSSSRSSRSRSSRIQNHQHQGILDPIYEIDEFSPEMRDRDFRVGSMNNEDSDARARQVEADEILARELQEQLYHEVPMFGGGEVRSFLSGFYLSFFLLMSSDLTLYLSTFHVY